MEQEIYYLIQNIPYLNPGDKNFLWQIFPQLSPLDKMRLKNSLSSNEPPQVLQNVQLLKAKFLPKPALNQQPNQAPANNAFQPQQKENNPNLLQKLGSAIFPEKKPEIVSPSVLINTEILGSKPPEPIQNQNIPDLPSLNNFSHLSQLRYLTPNHVNFGINSSAEQLLQTFFHKLENMFDSIDNIDVKRGYFMNFIQSPLFSNYLNTALTAMKHPEIKPRKVVLNTLYQTNPVFLNSKQFELTSSLSNHLRNLVGL